MKFTGDEIARLVSQHQLLEARLAFLIFKYEDAKRRLMDEDADAILKTINELRTELDRCEAALDQKSKATKPVQPSPPQLIFGELLKWLLRPGDYKKFVEPLIADMHAEYYACLDRGDVRGAKLAVWRGHWHAIPAWVWVMLWRIISRVIDWIRA